MRKHSLMLGYRSSAVVSFISASFFSLSTTCVNHNGKRSHRIT